MINLTKADETAKIDLTKGGDKISVIAEWTDNNDGMENDDLDLRASILLPGDRMFLIDGDYQGGTSDEPFTYHHGDVTSASKDEPGREFIDVARDIAKRAGGPVAIAFSVYSALDNGDVAVAELNPVMRISYGDEEVQCSYDFRQAAGKGKGVYTYVIGYAVVTEDSVILAPSGQTSRKGGEETPWPTWTGDELNIEMSGPAVFKGNEGRANRYNEQNGITKRFVNVGDEAPKKGFLKKLLG